MVKIFQPNGLKLGKDLKFLGFAQIACIYRMLKFKKILSFRFYMNRF